MPKESKTRPKESDETDSRPGSTSDDQKDHRYYYDDAHGYEEFDPEADEDDEDDEEAD